MEGLLFWGGRRRRSSKEGEGKVVRSALVGEGEPPSKVGDDDSEREDEEVRSATVEEQK